MELIEIKALEDVRVGRWQIGQTCVVGRKIEILCKDMDGIGAKWWPLQE